MSNVQRGWIYEKLDCRGAINSSFVTGVDKCIQFACSQQNHLSGDKARCPYKKCHNLKFMDVEIVKHYLYEIQIETTEEYETEDDEHKEDQKEKELEEDIDSD